jgi:GNAT superfamily N-acetyltransferase
MVDEDPDRQQKITIRSAVATDRPRLVELLGDLHGDRAETLTLPRVRQESRTLVAAVDGRAEGVLVATFVDYGLESYGSIEELVVAEDHHGAGAGRELVKRCLEWMRHEGADVVFVSALDDGVAGFYLSVGFARCVGPWLYARPGATRSAHGQRGAM